MFAIVNWCLAAVQGTIWSWLFSGIPSTAIRPIPNAGECPKFLRWGHGEAWEPAQRVSCLDAGNEPLCASGAALRGCCPAGVLREEV